MGFEWDSANPKEKHPFRFRGKGREEKIFENHSFTPRPPQLLTM
jgi:hypothetical protein